MGITPCHHGGSVGDRTAPAAAEPGTLSCECALSSMIVGSVAGTVGDDRRSCIGAGFVPCVFQWALRV
jgi:hypothetical protein